MDNSLKTPSDQNSRNSNVNAVSLQNLETCIFRELSKIGYSN
jgi:hypothetical protein